jgi:hypothetical protein
MECCEVLSLSAARCAPVGTGGTIGSTGGGAQGGGVPSNPPSRVGILEVSGTQVLNGANAHSGEAIYDGNRVTTGASSSGLINLDGGGSLRLDENTDPVFRFQLLKEGWCLVVNIVSGQMFDDTHTGGCVEINTPDGSGVVASSVNVHVGNSGSTWTVLKGAVRLIHPSGTVVHPFESVMVSKGKMVSIRHVSSDELARFTEWRFKYSFRPGRISYPLSGHPVPPVRRVPSPPPSYTSPPSYTPPPSYRPPVSSVPPRSYAPPAPPRPTGPSSPIIRMRVAPRPVATPTPGTPNIR